MKNFRYSKKPSDSFKSMLRKSGFLHMVNNSKVAGKYWRGCTSFNSLHEYEDLEQVYLTYIKRINSWDDGLGRLCWFTWNIIRITCFWSTDFFCNFAWRVLVYTSFK